MPEMNDIEEDFCSGPKPPSHTARIRGVRLLKAKVGINYLLAFFGFLPTKCFKKER